jgi:hypothetical protein
MHLHKLPKEIVPIAPRTWTEQSLQFAVTSFFFSASIIFFNVVSVQFACVTQQRYESDKLWECLIAACKAFSLANAKGKDINGLVIRSLD